MTKIVMKTMMMTQKCVLTVFVGKKYIKNIIFLDRHKKKTLKPKTRHEENTTVFAQNTTVCAQNTTVLAKKNTEMLRNSPNWSKIIQHNPKLFKWSKIFHNCL